MDRKDMDVEVRGLTDGSFPKLTGWCFLAVAITAPFNLPLGLVCWNLLNYVGGPAFADTHGYILMLVLLVVQVAAFGALYLPTYYFSRRASAPVRRRAILAITIVYLGFWSAWFGVILALMALTGASF
jgi:hypothetical protein